jgi:hypothetical protein
MDYAVLVNVTDGLRDRLENCDGFCGWQRTVGRDPLGEGAAVDILHDDAVLAVDLGKIIERGNPGMVQPGLDAGLILEPLNQGFVDALGSEYLDGYDAAKFGMNCAVDLSHPARADKIDQPVIAN